MCIYKYNTYNTHVLLTMLYRYNGHPSDLTVISGGSRWRGDRLHVRWHRSAHLPTRTFADLESTDVDCSDYSLMIYPKNHWRKGKLCSNRCSSIGRGAYFQTRPMWWASFTLGDLWGSRGTLAGIQSSQMTMTNRLKPWWRLGLPHDLRTYNSHLSVYPLLERSVSPHAP